MPCPFLHFLSSFPQPSIPRQIFGSQEWGCLDLLLDQPNNAHTLGHAPIYRSLLAINATTLAQLPPGYVDPFGYKPPAAYSLTLWTQKVSAADCFHAINVSFRFYPALDANSSAAANVTRRRLLQENAPAAGSVDPAEAPFFAKGPDGATRMIVGGRPARFTPGVGRPGSAAPSRKLLQSAMQSYNCDPYATTLTDLCGSLTWSLASFNYDPIAKSALNPSINASGLAGGDVLSCVNCYASLSTYVEWDIDGYGSQNCPPATKSVSNIHIHHFLLAVGGDFVMHAGLYAQASAGATISSSPLTIEKESTKPVGTVTFYILLVPFKISGYSQLTASFSGGVAGGSVAVSGGYGYTRSVRYGFEYLAHDCYTGVGTGSVNMSQIPGGPTKSSYGMNYIAEDSSTSSQDALAWSGAVGLTGSIQLTLLPQLRLSLYNTVNLNIIPMPYAGYSFSGQTATCGNNYQLYLGMRGQVVVPAFSVWGVDLGSDIGLPVTYGPFDIVNKTNANCTGGLCSGCIPCKYLSSVSFLPSVLPLYVLMLAILTIIE